nr:NADH dehydrogenase subunit 5, mitochondrial [Tanacetum cinerariifolium]
TESDFFLSSVPRNSWISCNMRLNAITLICILLLIGAAKKSAQIGSHTWSPDAMEGPTPVSALIHAATMVTAGVFMIARCSPLFEYPPTALIVITFAGAMTSFLAVSNIRFITVLTYGLTKRLPRARSIKGMAIGMGAS